VSQARAARSDAASRRSGFAPPERSPSIPAARAGRARAADASRPRIQAEFRCVRPRRLRCDADVNAAHTILARGMHQPAEGQDRMDASIGCASTARIACEVSDTAMSAAVRVAWPDEDVKSHDPAAADPGTGGWLLPGFPASATETRVVHCDIETGCPSTVESLIMVWAAMT